MTRKQALTELIAKVEAGDFTPEPGAAIMPHYWRFTALADIVFPQDVGAINVVAHDAYKGSLDAAKALHEAVLPKNCFWWVEHRPDGQFQSGVTVGNLGRCFQAFADTPARAWLLSILRALHAQEGGDA